ncbi:MAG: DNA mismatch repair endonuclease MutL [Bacteroidaceae bacterium]
MSDIIRLLPDSVANQIAAGEVIQRPASVIKELVENAVDAGATEIQIIVSDAGRTLIQVVDNGKGMSHTDARLSFERHATSKIKEASDLFALTTMGFRGEALASIAAVAQVELRTRMNSEELGTMLCISGSKVEKQETISCSVGSNFSVKNLFYNIPARRKFLKTNHTELSNILTEFERIVLVHSEIFFRLISNEQELFNLPKGNIRQRIVQIFGKRLNQQILPVEVATSLINITGFVGKPDSSKKKGAQQFFFVNNRYMRHPYFHKAVMEAYEKLIPVGEQVPYFLYLEVAPGDIDVNIHPTKTEIKFENEVAIWQIILAAVRESLGKYDAAPQIDFDTEDMPQIPVFESGTNFSSTFEPTVEYDLSYNPFQDSANSYRPSRQTAEWESFYPPVEKNSSNDLPPNVIMESDSCLALSAKEAPLNQNATTTTSPLDLGYQPFQVKGRYILLSVKSGLLFIDQRRAHIRVLFEQYKTQLTLQKGSSQRLLFPEILELSPHESAFLKEIETELHALGFDLSDLGGGSYSLSAAPGGIDGIPPTRLISDLLHAAMESGSTIADKVHYELALTMARSTAIVYGQVLSVEEMTRLVDSLFSCSLQNHTPDGKTILYLQKEEELDRPFK